MSLQEEIRLQAKIHHEPENIHAFHKLLQLLIRKGELHHAFSVVLEHFLLRPEEPTRKQLYHYRKTLYLAQEKELSPRDPDRMLLLPIPFSQGILVLLGGRIGSQVTQLQETLHPMLSTPQVLLDFSHVRFIDSASLGYLGQWLHERKKSPFKTYGIEMNERVHICFKHLNLYPLLNGPAEKTPQLLLSDCLLSLTK